MYGNETISRSRAFSGKVRPGNASTMTLPISAVKQYCGPVLSGEGGGETIGTLDFSTLCPTMTRTVAVPLTSEICYRLTCR